MDQTFKKNSESRKPLREFYYIQMEKYARVAISEGIRIADEIHVTIESEIYRALNLHYNRNQQLEALISNTLVMFVRLCSHNSSLQAIKLYSCQMDQPVPEFFKSPNWMDQLADG
uniref:Homeobox protein prospero n=1 Tax=Schistosoma haematobium TaxID=6185 RepID=A0A095BZ55_SCHHA